MPRTSQSTLFIFQIVKLPFYRAAGNTLINTEEGQCFHIQGLSFILQTVTKISAVYKFHKGRVAADRRWQF